MTELSLRLGSGARYVRTLSAKQTAGCWTTVAVSTAAVLTTFAAAWGQAASLPQEPDTRTIVDGLAASRTPVRFTGTVVDPPRRGVRTTRLLVEISRAELAGGERLSLGGRVLLFVRHAGTPFELGDRIVFSSRPRPIVSYGNPGEFDYARWYARRGIAVSAFVWDGADIEREGLDPDASWRLRTRRAIARAAARERGQAGALLAAFACGDRSRLASGSVNALRASGLAHLLAISGVHVGFVASLVFAFVRFLLGCFHWAERGRDPVRPAALCAAGAILAYAFVSGGGPSVVRATVMGLAALFALWRGSLSRGGVALIVAAPAVVLGGYSPGEAGFQLSFAAAGALVCVFGGRALPRSLAGKFRTAVLVSILCWAVTSPILAYHFGYVPTYAALASLLAMVPAGVAVGAAVAGGALLGVSQGLAAFVFDLGALAAGAVLKLAEGVASLPYAEVAVVQPSPWLAAALAVFPMAIGLRAPLRHCVVALLAIVAVTAVVAQVYERYRDDRMRVLFVSVGQGDATIVIAPGGAVTVVDAGPPGRGRTVVAPLLRRLGIARIDLLVLTHAQADHYGGAEELFDAFPVARVWHPGGRCEQSGFRTLLERARRASAVLVDVGAAGASAVFPVAGHPASWRVRALWPRNERGRCEDNDRSIVLALEYAGVRILLPGDAEAAAERMLSSRPNAIRAPLLKLGHHGSATSSSEAFLDAVAPLVAVASAGRWNRYGFPSPVVVERLERRGVLVYRTDRDGAIDVWVDDGGGVSVDCTRCGTSLTNRLVRQ